MVDGQEVRRGRKQVTKEPASQILLSGQRRCPTNPQPSPSSCQLEGETRRALWTLQPETSPGGRLDTRRRPRRRKPCSTENPVSIQARGSHKGHRKKAMCGKLQFKSWRTPAYTGVVEAKGTQEEGHV